MNSLARDARTSAALSSSERRSLGGIAAQPGNAAAAASAHRLASSSDAAAARVAISPVSGSRRSKTLPSVAGVSLLLMKSVAFISFLRKIAHVFLPGATDASSLAGAMYSIEYSEPASRPQAHGSTH
jgi:hypothetical protein